MQNFPVGSDAVVEIPFWNNDGDPITPTGLSYRVTGSWGDEIVVPTVIANLTGTSTTITVPAAVFALPGGYTIELSIAVGSQTFIQETIVGIVPVARLEFLRNTFLSRAGAAYVASSIPNLVYWVGAEKGDHEVALMEAFRRITLMSFSVPWPTSNAQDRIEDDEQSIITPRMWPLMTTTAFAEYPEHFRYALTHAQLIEANAVLASANDPLTARRRGGVFSEKIGESSIMFKSGVRPLDEDTISRAALNLLSQFLNNRITTTRA